jgi:hypothetical protein
VYILFFPVFFPAAIIFVSQTTFPGQALNAKGQRMNKFWKDAESVVRQIVKSLLSVLIFLVKLPIKAPWFLLGCVGGLLYWTLEKVLDWTVDWGDWWRQGPVLPYTVEFIVPSAFDLRGLSLSQFGRLLFVQLVEEGTQARLLTHWKDVSSYNRQAGHFDRQMHAVAGTATPTPSRVWSGNHLEAHTPSEPWWQRRATFAWAVLASIIATIGYWEKLRDFLTGTVSGPSAELTAVRGEVDVLAREDFEVEFEVRNTSPWVTCAVNFDDIQLQSVQDPKGSGLRLERRQPRPYSSLKPGTAEKFKVSGRAKTAGEYQLAVTGRTTTQFRSAALILPEEPGAQLPHQNVFLHVWPRRTVGYRHLERHSDYFCQIKCEFMVGDEFLKGFEVDAQLDREPELEFDRLRFPGAPSPHRSNVDKPGAEVTQLTWQAQDIAVKKRYEFSVFLRDPKQKKIRSEADWKKIMDRIQVSFGTLAKKPVK